VEAVVCAALLDQHAGRSTSGHFVRAGLTEQEVRLAKERLVHRRVLVPITGAPPEVADRELWMRRGWAAAFDLFIDLRASAVDGPSTPRWIDGDRAGDGPRSPIRQHFPQVPGHPGPTTVDLVEDILGISGASMAAEHLRPEILVHVVAVEGLPPGWFHVGGDPGQWKQTASGWPSERLASLLPVSVGRADFDVDATLLVVHRADPPDRVDPMAYASIHVEAGSMLAGMEARSAGLRLAFMAHYAADARLVDALELPSAAWVMGAISIGAQHG